MNLLMALPILVPFLTAGIGLLTRRHLAMQRRISFVGAAFLLYSSVLLLKEILASGIQVLQLGSWPAPYGITFVADILSGTMVVITGLIGLASVTYSLQTIDRERQAFGYYPVTLLLLFGINGAFLTGDIFNLYVWFEVLLISSFVLLSMGRSRSQIAGTVPYVVMNLLGSMLFLIAVGLLYGNTGSLNFAHLSLKLSDPVLAAVAQPISLLLLGAFGLKAAIFPLFFWLPASYPAPPVAVSALFAGLLTKVGVYALIRTFTLLFPLPLGEPNQLLISISGLTMITGVLGAVAQNEFRRVLSFHIVSQIGYMTMGLALNTRLGIAASFFYIVHHIIVKTNLFFVSGVVQLSGGSFRLQQLGGTYRLSPFLSLLFLVSAFSLAGLPPLSGFWGKFLLAQAGLESGQFPIVVISLVVGLLTTFSMTKIWNEVFWKNAPNSARINPLNRTQQLYLLLPITVLALITVVIGLFTDPFSSIALRAADELIGKQAYVKLVLQNTGGANP
ncbi:MAG: NADH/ubiquinone/plastoquinone [Bdellovibrionales bacterium RIFOXYC1_FULL_54_43]|nr:MAG: NADH/ubiquinone/plastoquinone [Bdellovibrionales bacterium RIFOXYC1_FULL_54_43]OFZ83278.1 MAG: NADH/ubiquinone/plastoquinone [Bdellovibrionales bacterium RIFOXYD1_FULL_55_31]